MGNKLRGEVEIELAGSPYTLVFGNDEICAIEQAFNDRSIDEIFFSGTIPRRAVREAIRVGLAQRHRRMTPRKVSRLLDESMADDPLAYAKIMEAVVCAVMYANGTKAEDIEYLRNEMRQEIAQAESADRDLQLPTKRGRPLEEIDPSDPSQAGGTGSD